MAHIRGLAAFRFAGLFYAAALRFLPLNVAQSYAASQFVAVILASRLLGEPIVFERWIGISLISGGIVVVVATQNVR
jgi:undecaprenyl phosphate-alpha-L-ara4N flippase subunit ArnE